MLYETPHEYVQQHKRGFNRKERTNLAFNSLKESFWNYKA